jgi:Resolvase, N terminal domain
MRADIYAHQKVTASHLQREAYLYVRQSTLRQVFENTESTKRQYALRERAVGLGWSGDRVVVIDSDLGQSGAASDREGFQNLVAAVGMGQVGVVLGLEVSRLARSSTDWHRLLEICALTDTLILDEDGLYESAAEPRPWPGTPFSRAKRMRSQLMRKNSASPSSARPSSPASPPCRR